MVCAGAPPTARQGHSLSLIPLLPSCCALRAGRGAQPRSAGRRGWAAAPLIYGALLPY